MPYFDCTPTALRALRLCLKQSPAVASEWAEPPETGCWAPEWLSEEAPRWIDHIAFRTFAVEGMGMQDLAQLFLRLGYRKAEDKLAFPGKKLEAIWLSPPQAHLPRIFISQLKVEELSARSRGILDRLLEHAGPDITERLGLFLPSHPHRFLPWQACTSSDYAALLEESEYAAWTITNGFLANHIAVRVHGLLLDQQHGPGIEQLASTLQNEGYDLNASGGLIKRSEDGLLLQFATKADRVPFRGSSHPEPSKTEDMAGCYVEFAERLVLPEFADLPLSDVQEHHRRDGFEAANADKIFESTFVHAPS